MDNEEQLLDNGENTSGKFSKNSWEIKRKNKRPFYGKRFNNIWSCWQKQLEHEQESWTTEENIIDSGSNTAGQLSKNSWNMSQKQNKT